MVETGSSEAGRQRMVAGRPQSREAGRGVVKKQKSLGVHWPRGKVKAELTDMIWWQAVHICIEAGFCAW